MASNEFRACKKVIKQSTSREEIRIAVDKLDAQWEAKNQSNKIMRDKDWPVLVMCIHKATTRIDNKNKKV